MLATDCTRQQLRSFRTRTLSRPVLLRAYQRKNGRASSYCLAWFLVLRAIECMGEFRLPALITQWKRILTDHQKNIPGPRITERFIAGTRFTRPIQCISELLAAPTCQPKHHEGVHHDTVSTQLQRNCQRTAPCWIVQRYTVRAVTTVHSIQ